MFQTLTDSNIRQINKEGWYWAQGNEVMGNFGDTNTLLFVCVEITKRQNEWLWV